MSTQVAPAPAQTAPTRTPGRSLDDVPGWLRHTDKLLFKWLLLRQRETGPPGNLVELGVYLGKSAIHMARYLQPGETFTVCDLFDGARDDDSIRPGARKAYADLTQREFERNFLDFHDTLPAIVRGRTSEIVDHVAPGTCRFVHIDASHMYEHVREDLHSTRRLLRPDGLVVCDDYRTEHTPGTAAAVWEAVVSDGLQIVCTSADKFYGTWGDPTPLQEHLIGRVAQQADHRCDFQSVLGQRLIRVVRTGNPQQATGGQHTSHDCARLLQESERALATARKVVAAAGTRAASPRPRWRRAGRALLPPVVTSALRAVRNR